MYCKGHCVNTPLFSSTSWTILHMCSTQNTKNIQNALIMPILKHLMSKLNRATLKCHNRLLCIENVNIRMYIYLSAKFLRVTWLWPGFFISTVMKCLKLHHYTKIQYWMYMYVENDYLVLSCVMCRALKSSSQELLGQS